MYKILIQYIKFFHFHFFLKMNEIKALNEKEFSTDKIPICFAIGDIEGDINKLRNIDYTIQKYSETSFIFIGDIINDLSDESTNKNANLSCIEFINQKYLINEDNDDNESNIDSLLNAFRQIKWTEKKYDEIKNRVKFIAGNSEYDSLCDFQQKPQRVRNKYIFGRGKWQKTVTLDQLRLLYRYLKNCYSVIKMEDKNLPGFKKTIFFRHSLKKFDEKRISPEILDQRLHVTYEDFEMKKFIIISGHSKLFAYEEPYKSQDKEMFFTIDTSTIKDKSRDWRNTNKYPDEIIGKGTNDLRIAAVTTNKYGYFVEAFPKPFKFEKSPLKISFDDLE